MINFKFHSRTAILIHDLCMIGVAWIGAYWLRFDLGVIPAAFLSAAFGSMPLVVLIQAVFFYFFQLYRGVWQFFSIPDLVRIIKSVLIGSLTITLALFFYNRLEFIPRSVLLLYAGMLVLLLSTSRFLFRFIKDRHLTRPRGKRTLIIGAGSAGEMLARDLLRDSSSGFYPVIFLDDDTHKRTRDIHGIRVGGLISEAPRVVEKFQIEMILIAVPSASDSNMRRIVSICEQCNLSFQTLPSVEELFSGQVSRKNLREVSIEDLLGRDPVHLDWEMIGETLKNKSILVTGGGGSIGSELCRQIARIGPKKLIIFDQSEYNLYKINAELADTYPNLQLNAILGDVTDRVSVTQLFSHFKPEIIFHVAAYKHVPLLETQARVAIHNNVIGTKTVAELAVKSNVKRFVLISTDKAVNPTNVMGATKRASEILCQNLNDPDGTRFITVRFGNVLNSAGSVVPLFREQIKAGGPVTVTDPEITRYFMTITEASQLIMQAEAVGQGGEIFVLDMGDPIKISFLAEQMILLSGKQLNKDIKIEYIGLRPGEKLFEELFHDQEKLIRTPYDKLRLAQARMYNKSVWISHIEELADACQNNDDKQTLSILKSLVPEFSPKKP